MFREEGAIDLDQIPAGFGMGVREVRRRAEERILEIRHRLVLDTACADSGFVSGSLDVEEELLDELRELEQIIAAEESGGSEVRVPRR